MKISEAASAAASLSENTLGKGEDMKIEQIYLCLLKILLSPPTDSAPPTVGSNGDIVKLVSSGAGPAPKAIDAHRLRLVMEAAERHCDKIDACAFLELLPKNVPVASVVNFVALAMESVTANQHNLQVHIWYMALMYSYNALLILNRSSTSCCACAK